MKLCIFSELSRGGIADYAHEQATALRDRGIEVTLMCAPEFLLTRQPRYEVVPILQELRPLEGKRSGLRRKAALVTGIVANANTLADDVKVRRYDAVLTHFGEYLAPLWAWKMRRLRAEGISFYSVLHDPVRDYIVGPRWWHERSVMEAYSFLDGVFVHSIERAHIPDHVAVEWIPHGIFNYPSPKLGRTSVRQALGLPLEKKIITAFGYIRDNKNLDLVIRALTDLPDIHLVVAGTEQGGGNKTLDFYRDLATDLGVANRCHWFNRFISSEETADLLSASDLSVLTYSSDFLSASAALGMSANYRLPCLISSGSSTTRQLVDDYRIGVWVEPDDVDAIRQGLRKWLAEGIQPRWEAYSFEQSWARNAEIIQQKIEAGFDKSAQRVRE